MSKDEKNLNASESGVNRNTANFNTSIFDGKKDLLANNEKLLIKNYSDIRENILEPIESDMNVISKMKN